MNTNSPSFFKDAIETASKLLPANSQQMREDIEKTLRSLVESRLREMDVVSKEEFNANQQLLDRLKAKVSELEAQVEKLQSAES